MPLDRLIGNWCRIDSPEALRQSYHCAQTARCRCTMRTTLLTGEDGSQTSITGVKSIQFLCPCTYLKQRTSDLHQYYTAVYVYIDHLITWRRWMPQLEDSACVGKQYSISLRQLPSELVKSLNTHMAARIISIIDQLWERCKVYCFVSTREVPMVLGWCRSDLPIGAHNGATDCRGARNATAAQCVYSSLFLRLITVGLYAIWHALIWLPIFSLLL